MDSEDGAAASAVLGALAVACCATPPGDVGAVEGVEEQDVPNAAGEQDVPNAAGEQDVPNAAGVSAALAVVAVSHPMGCDDTAAVHVSGALSIVTALVWIDTAAEGACILAAAILQAAFHWRNMRTSREIRWNEEWDNATDTRVSMFNPPRGDEVRTAVMITLNNLQRVDGSEPPGKQFMCEWQIACSNPVQASKKCEAVLQTDALATKLGKVTVVDPEREEMLLRGGGRTSWRTMEGTKATWCEYFVMPLVVLPRPPVHPDQRMFLEFTFYKKDRREKSAPLLCGRVKVELRYENDKRKRASLIFLSASEDASPSRYCFNIEVAMKANPCRPEGGTSLFPARRGVPGSVVEGVAAMSPDDLPRATHTEKMKHSDDGGSTSDGSTSTKRKKPKLMKTGRSSGTVSDRNDAPQLDMKRCGRCGEEYSVDFNNDDSCEKGKHMGELECRNSLVARNLALTALGGAVLGTTVGALAGMTVAKGGAAGAAKVHGASTAKIALTGATRAMNAGMGITPGTPNTAAADASQSAAVRGMAGGAGGGGGWHIGGGSFWEWTFNPMHPTVMGLEIGTVVGLAAGGVCTATETLGMSPYRWSCCNAMEDVKLCTVKMFHVEATEEGEGDGEKEEKPAPS